MNASHNFVIPKKINRIFSAGLNFVIFIILAIFLDRFVMSYTYKKWTHYDVVKQEYSEKYKEYEDIQDEYNLYYYDENENRIQNKEVEQTVLDNFKADQRIINLDKEIPTLEKKLLGIDLSSLGISYLISSLGIMTLCSFAFGRGRSIGGLLLNVAYKNEDYTVPSAKTVFKYDLLSFLFHYILSPMLIFIPSIVFLYQIYYNEKSQSSLEKWLHIIYLSKD